MPRWAHTTVVKRFSKMERLFFFYSRMELTINRFNKVNIFLDVNKDLGLYQLTDKP